MLRRVLTRLGCEPGTLREKVALADLSPAQLKVVYGVVLVLLAGGVLTICRQPYWRTSASQWATEMSLILLSTMWFSPIVWSYHPTAATPALALALGRTEGNPRLQRAVILLWIAALGLFAWRLACSLGQMLWTSLLLTATLVWTGRSRECADRILQSTPANRDKETLASAHT